MKKIIRIALVLLFIEFTLSRDVSAIAQVKTKEVLNPKIVLARIRTSSKVETENITSLPLTLNKDGFKYENLNSKVPLIIKSDIKVIAKNITYSNATIEGNLYIAADNVRLNNLKVNGTVFIDPGKDGTTTLNNITANNIIVLSGGERGIYLNKVLSNTLSINSYYKVKVETMDTTKIKTTTVNSNALLDSQLGTFGSVIIEKKDKEEVNVEFRGTFLEPVIVKTAAIITAGAASNIEKVKILPEDSNETVFLYGEFKNIDINKSAEIEFSDNTKVTGQVKIASYAKIKTSATAEVAVVDIAPDNKYDNVILSGEGIFKEVKLSREAKLLLKDSVQIRDNLLIAASSVIEALSVNGIRKIEIASNIITEDLIEIKGSNIQLVDVYSSAKVSFKENINTSVNIKVSNANIKTTKEAAITLDTNGHAAILIEAENYSRISYEDLDTIHNSIENQIYTNKIVDKQLEEKALLEKNTLLEKIVKEKLMVQKKLIDENSNYNNQPGTQAYLEFITINDYNDKLTVVNKNRSLPDNWRPNDLVQVKVPYKGRSDAKYMRREAADALAKLFAKAKKDRINIYAVSGFRSFGLQKIVYAKNVAQLGEARAKMQSAFPGKSEHQTGLAMDISSPTLRYTLKQIFGNTVEGKWLKENAGQFGFIIRYPQGKEAITGYIYEPWHIRYVGSTVAVEIMGRGITLEEYLGVVK